MTRYGMILVGLLSGGDYGPVSMPRPGDTTRHSTLVLATGTSWIWSTHKPWSCKIRLWRYTLPSRAVAHT
ncbi:hypothetical protein PLICRDRAFT_449661 [Plicaturopsis crispa FD-325 SS-3]|uniref:Uncharacterized protein n=1 Tax=Plicaturopsis crispa FD-325 SS-3 TaxID=944288 RepID=A0A0C9T0N5_PLICR|nr:hypothetical protein PLICRDRAFT_449661 [Plicaturopsis crispa FD-325 SS-3]